MKHKLLSTAAVLLLVLLTWSCTATDDEIVQTPATTGTRPAGAQRSLSITIAPKPAFAEAAITLPHGKNSPTTRAVQTEQGTEWEEGDVVWLNTQFESEDGVTSNYYSALKYSGGAWRYLTEAEADEMGLNDDPKFNRTLIIYDGYKVGRIGGYYVGNGKPQNGIITIPAPDSNDAIPVMQALGIKSPQGNSEYWSLPFPYRCSRLRIPAGYGLDMTYYIYFVSYAPSYGYLHEASSPTSNSPQPIRTETSSFSPWCTIRVLPSPSPSTAEQCGHSRPSPQAVTRGTTACHTPFRRSGTGG